MISRQRLLQIVVLPALLGLALGAAGANTLAAHPSVDAAVDLTTGTGLAGSPLVRKSDTSPALANLPVRASQQKNRAEVAEVTGTTTGTVTPPATTTGTATPPATQTRTQTPLATTTQTATTVANTATVTATACPLGSAYTVTTSTGVIVPGFNDTGNHADEGTTMITLPFAVMLYGQTFTTATVGSNGTLSFGSVLNFSVNACLPVTGVSNEIFPYWDDQETLTTAPGCSNLIGGCGIFTLQVGNTFYIEYRTVLFSNPATALDYEVVLTQGSPNFQLVYGSPISDVASETVGVQGSTSSFTQYKCNTDIPALSPGLQLNFTLACVQPSATATATGTSTATQTAVQDTATPTQTTVANTATPTSVLPTVTVIPTVTITVVPPTMTVTPTETPPLTTSTATPTGILPTVTVVLPTMTTTPTNVANTATSTATRTSVPNTATVTATPTLCPGTTQTFSGSITAADRSHNSSVNVAGAPSSCAVPHPYPGTFGVAPYNYDTYTVTNTSSSPQCITVLVNGSACGNTSGVQVELYRGSFDPTNLATNYLGDSGDPGVTGQRTLSVTVPANTVLVIVVDEYINTRGCASYTLTVSGLPCASGTATATSVATRTATSVATTGTPVATATACPIRFSDVTDPTAYYYQGVYYLACRGVISGYSDGTYKPFNNTTRGQMTKIVTLAFNIPLVTPPATGTFTDVDSSNVFYQLIETAARRGIVSGYTCGGVNSQTGAPEPCDSTRRPYFRPSNFVTRGQLTKIVVGGAGFPLINPLTPTFTDVARDNVFYQSIETAVCHGTIAGYDDHTFRPNNYAFRGQIAKIVYLAVTNPAGTCSTR